MYSMINGNLIDDDNEGCYNCVCLWDTTDPDSLLEIYGVSASTSRLDMVQFTNSGEYIDSYGFYYYINDNMLTLWPSNGGSIGGLYQRQ